MYKTCLCTRPFIWFSTFNPCFKTLPSCATRNSLLVRTVRRKMFQFGIVSQHACLLTLCSFCAAWRENVFPSTENKGALFPGRLWKRKLPENSSDRPMLGRGTALAPATQRAQYALSHLRRRGESASHSRPSAGRLTDSGDPLCTRPARG